jgi:hypothetical protein
MHIISVVHKGKLSWHQFIFKILSFIAPLLVQYNCQSQQVISEKKRVSQIHSIVVVAMDPPPLVVLPNFDTFSSSGGGNGYGDLVLLIIYGVKYSVTAPQLKQEAKIKTKNYKSILSVDWTPTIVLANQVVELMKRNPGVCVTLKPGVQDVPGTDKYSMSYSIRKDWNLPLRDWYNNDQSVNYANSELIPDAILLIEINYYVLQREVLSTEIYTKLVDGKTGNVIKKSLSHESINLGNEELAISNNATIFKEKFSKMSHSLLEKNLKKLNLIR